MVHPTSELWIYGKDCFTILHNERGQERHGFSGRNLIQRNLFVLEQKWYDFFITLNLLSGYFISFTQ